MEPKGHFQLQIMTQSTMLLREKLSMILKEKHNMGFECPPTLSHISRHMLICLLGEL